MQGPRKTTNHKTIPITELRPGMNVVSVHENHTPVYNNKPFIAYDDFVINKVIESGAKTATIINVTIDEIDDPDDAQDESQLSTPLPVDAEFLGQTFERAERIYDQTTSVIRTYMEGIKVGKKIQKDDLAPLADEIIQLSYQNPHALCAVSRIKQKDEYTFQHSISVAALMVSYARHMGIDDNQLTDVATGGLIHDLGKVQIPSQLLNKPGPLTAEEYQTVKLHVDHCREYLQDAQDISEISIDIALQHHERQDGSGYPLGITKDQFSLLGSMTTIVDVYDALTSERSYKHAWEPGQALKHLMISAPQQFSDRHLQQFIKFIGIYPVGSWVRLQSGYIGKVIYQNNELLKPVVRLIYSTNGNKKIRPFDIDLSVSDEHTVIEAVSPWEFGL